VSPVGLAPPPAPEIPDLDLFDALTFVDLPRRRADEDLWFSDAPADLERAKALCADCPVRRACLAGALERREYCGVWGGEIFDRGAVIARKRPRGRPSKADLARDAELAAARAAAGVA
jgi:WhiB family transcriptional regulator, redox-sensing transcriptional regulator